MHIVFYILSLLLTFQIQSLDFFDLFFNNQQKEKILLFDCNIIINKDATLDVTETIYINAQGKQIKRGITREFPSYNKFNRLFIDYKINKISRNDKPEPYSIQDGAHGKKFYIGSRDYILQHGIHKYTINYSTNRQINFLKIYDELYLNVTGNETNFIIDKVRATIHLPKKIDPKKLKFDAFTGYKGLAGKNFKTEIHDKKIIFETIESLSEFEGLTIAIALPKGFIIEPDFYNKIKDFFKYNKNLFLTILWFIIWLTIVLIIYLKQLFKIKKNPNEIITPNFEPPNNLPPGDIRYIYNMKYDNKILTSVIIDMAVKKFLKIEYLNNRHKLIKLNQPEINDTYFNAWSILFKKNEQVSLEKQNCAMIAKLINDIKLDLELKYNNKYFVDNNDYVFFGIIFSLIAIIPLYLYTTLFFLALFILILLNLIFSKLIKTYTTLGAKIKAQIDGFKLFLEVTEKDRINFFSNPQKAIEFYESYLPYAIALNVEKKWSKQFDIYFEQIKKENLNYSNNWYISNNYNNFFFIPAIVTHLDQTFNEITDSAQNFSGTKSAFDQNDQGYSGGGSGGGSVGGW